MTDEALNGYEGMMNECVVKVEKFTPLCRANLIRKELDQRGKVKLVSGSYDDVGKALIHRIAR